MTAAKSETITVRVEPGVKNALKAMADEERRSQANMLEIMIRDYCGRKGIAVPDPVAVPAEETVVS